MTAEFVSVLPSASMAGELVEEKVSGERWLNVDVDIIRRSKDPWTCPEHLLNFLAFERSVDIWNPDWTIEKKRRVIAAAIQDHQLKGTKEGIRRYIDHADGGLVQVVAPPQGIYAAPGLTKAEWAAWIARHPKVRITLAHGTEEKKRLHGTYAGATFAGWDYDAIDISPALSGRRAYLYRNGEQSPLDLHSITTTVGQQTGVVEERITVPGRDLNGIYAGHAWAGYSFVAGNVAPVDYAVSLDRTYNSVTSELHLTTVPVGFLPRDTKYVRESLTGIDKFGCYAGRGFVGTKFVTRDISGELLADVLYLHDPSVISPKMAGISFAGFSRVGIEDYTAQLLIDLKDAPHRRATYAGHGYLGREWAVPDDPTHRKGLLAAVRSAKALRDGIGVSFKTKRPRTLEDGIPLDGSYRFGALVKNRI